MASSKLEGSWVHFPAPTSQMHGAVVAHYSLLQSAPSLVEPCKQVASQLSPCT